MHTAHLQPVIGDVGEFGQHQVTELRVVAQSLDTLILDAAARQVQAGERRDATQQLHPRVRDVSTIAETKAGQRAAATQSRGTNKWKGSHMYMHMYMYMHMCANIYMCSV